MDDEKIMMEIVLDRIDELDGAQVRLRVCVEVEASGSVGRDACTALVRDALVAAFGLGQQRYGILLVEMPSRKNAVEGAAKDLVALGLARVGAMLERFELVELEVVD